MLTVALSVRALILAVALVAMPQAVVTAAEPYVVIVDWMSGHFIAGTPIVIGTLDDGAPVPPSGVGPLNQVRVPFTLDACHRTLLVDLVYDPETLDFDVPDVGGATARYEFNVEVVRDGTVVASRAVRASGHALAMGTHEAGVYDLRVSLILGLDVDWALRVRAKEVVAELACEPVILVNEVESNPGGVDAGAEWVELHNPSDVLVDLGGWTLTTTHGVTRTLTLEPGTRIPPGAYLIIHFADGQFLDNADESVGLRDNFGRERDVTPVVSDPYDDARTWQRGAEGPHPWAFAPGTQGAVNVADPG